ncbi:MAG: CRISPR-associated endonuclease Cas2 [Acidobacteria bacterium]|jgi:CRISPR-associated protein Cas2|nr:CRISPR-associated endonuclease Cas2 [Acidobacteriota bacterium]
MEERDLYIAAYDIASPRRMRAALQLVKGHATGGQKSAYECFLTPAERRTLLYRLDAVIEPDEDRVLLIRLDPRSRVHTLGIAEEPQDPPFFYCG